jgi:hypothetical protein
VGINGTFAALRHHLKDLERDVVIGKARLYLLALLDSQ